MLFSGRVGYAYFLENRNLRENYCRVMIKRSLLSASIDRMF